MSGKAIRAILAGSVLMIAPSLLFAQGGEKDPDIPYQKAVDSFGDLKLEKARLWADIVLKDFPGSKQAARALLLKAAITTVKIQTFDTLGSKYAEGIRKAVLYEDKKKNRQLYADAVKKVLENGEVLIADYEALSKHIGKPMVVEIRKNYESLTVLNDAYVPYKMLEKGFPPTPREQKKIEKHVANMSFCFVVSRILYGTASGGYKEIAGSLEKKVSLKGAVDWAGTMTAIGDWLVQYATVCYVGWIDLDRGAKMRDLKRARKGYAVARECFSRAAALMKDKPYHDTKVHADQRVKEIDSVITTIDKALK